ncbi:hypothetical protein C2S51_032013 [Perilla frutescens var. frutescens]|nr:hypothetical protein C2S51_032013 [Perilla frutescens var. frutescens]
MENRVSSADELALTKSAAWAWLEHGSGCNVRSPPEFDVSRAKFDAKPSRYKAESVRKLKEKTPIKSTTHSNNGYYSLLDRYDIERISRQLDYYIESSRRPNRRDGGYDGRRAEAEAEMKSKHGGKKVRKGLWLGSHAPLACGTSRDEVVNIECSRRRRSLEKRRATAVEVVGCRPRQGIRA